MYQRHVIQRPLQRAFAWTLSCMSMLGMGRNGAYSAACVRNRANSDASSVTVHSWRRIRPLQPSLGVAGIWLLPRRWLALSRHKPIWLHTKSALYCQPPTFLPDLGHCSGSATSGEEMFWAAPHE